MKHILFSSAIALLLSCNQAQQKATPVTIAPPADSTGFTSIFDGKDLAGWDFDSTVWRVENGAAVGEVVSGTQSPSLNNGIGMGYVRPDCAVIGGKIEIEIRGRRFAAEVVKKPIYKPA